jgi:hypothetical protein
VLNTIHDLSASFSGAAAKTQWISAAAAAGCPKSDMGQERRRDHDTADHDGLQNKQTPVARFGNFIV